MTLEKLENEEGWFYVKITMSIKSFLAKFGKIGISGYYRLISNSGYLFLGKTNREWFKSTFVEGFYRAIIAEDEVSIVMILKCKNPSQEDWIQKELKIRVKKLLYAIVDIGSINDLPKDEKTLLNSNFGFELYQRILETYVKRMKTSR